MIDEVAEEKKRYSNASEARVRDHRKGCGSGSRGRRSGGTFAADRYALVPTRTCNAEDVKCANKARSV